MFSEDQYKAMIAAQDRAIVEAENNYRTTLRELSKERRLLVVGLQNICPHTAVTVGSFYNYHRGHDEYTDVCDNCKKEVRHY